jgi:protein-tyrosine phosphatase
LTRTEHIQEAKKREAKVQSSEAVPQSNQATTEPLEIPGIKYHPINFNGSAYSKMLIKQLSWGNTARLIGHMAIGQRTQGIKILGDNVMTPRGLIGLAIDSVDACGAEVCQFFTLLADASNLPLVVHCTQGKDRTGLTVLMVELLLGASVEAANYDYMLSQGELVSEREERLVEINSIGLPDEFAGCDPQLVAKVDEHIRGVYGSIEQYLDKNGVGEEMQERVRKNLGAEIGASSAKP